MSVEKGVVSGASAFTYQSRITGNDCITSSQSLGMLTAQLVSFSFSFFVSKPKDLINVFSCAL